MTNTPHDGLFKAVFEQPEHAADELRHILPRHVVEAIRWSTLRPMPGTFIDPKLAEERTDLLFAAELNSGEPVVIFVVFEHQSSNDRRMALRLYGYMHEIWVKCDREQKGEYLPLVLPVVLCQVDGGWTSPTRFSDLFNPALGDLRQLLPDFEYAIDDLAHVSDDDLRERALADLPKLALWIMRDVRNGEALLRALDEWAGLLEAVVRAPSGRAAAMLLLRYIVLAADKLHADAFRAKLRGIAPAAEALAMTIAEQMRAEGEAKGRAEGEAKGKAESERARRALVRAIVALLEGRQLHVSPEVRVRLEAAQELEELEGWLTRAASVEHAEQVFG